MNLVGAAWAAASPVQWAAVAELRVGIALIHLLNTRLGQPVRMAQVHLLGCVCAFTHTCESI